MKALATTLISLILGLWVVAIAILSIQNVFILDDMGESTLVSLQFFGMSSIEMPLGVLLSVSVAIGMISTGIMLLALTKHERPSPPRQRTSVQKKRRA